MNYEKKVEIMKNAILAELLFPEEQMNSIEKGIIDGFLKIAHLENLERLSMEPAVYIPVERVQEGFGFWNSGGYNPNGRMGSAAVAAGVDGERLKIVRYVSEQNGKHCLAVVYHGCYIAISVAKDTLESDNTSVYQISGFQRSDNGFTAKCFKVFQMSPSMSRLSASDEDKLNRLIGVSNRIATSVNLVKLRDWV